MYILGNLTRWCMITFVSLNAKGDQTCSSFSEEGMHDGPNCVQNRHLFVNKAKIKAAQKCIRTSLHIFANTETWETCLHKK